MNPQQVDAIVRDAAAAPLPPRERALVAYAIKLTRAPRTLTEDYIRSLRAVGLSDRAIHDAAAVIGYFNFVNRLAQGLGVDAGAEVDPRLL